MKKLIYCKTCGSILDKDNVQQIVHRDFASKKSKTLFEVCPACLDKIINMQVPDDKLVLKRTDGKRYWREFEIEHFMNKNSTNLLICLDRLYQYQTDEEKATRETKYDNAVGFNKPDSNFLTGMAKKYIAEGKKPDGFTELQIEKISKLMQKYISQLTIIANA